jgi:hypothetical protein
MRIERSALLAIVLVAMAACGRGRPPAGGPPPATVMPPPVPLYYDNGGGVRDSVREIVRDRARFEQIWQQATSTQASPPQLPAVDFNREMVILVASGAMTPEDQIHVDSLLVRPELTPENRRVETLSVVVRTVIGCRRFRTEAFPVEIVRARRFDGPVKFDDRTADGCRGEPDRP